mgnify:CR=1 FL=1
MKNLAKVLTLILAVTFLATGCNLLNKEESVTTPQIVNADNVLDQQIYQRAISMQDSKACETIVNESVKEECENVTNALVLTDQAVNDLDKKICGKIKLDRYEDECEAKVEAILAQQKADEKAQEEVAKQEEERLEIADKAMENNDYTLCETIEDNNQKKACKFNVIINIVNETKDGKLCDEIGDDWMSEECKKTLTE